MLNLTNITSFSNYYFVRSLFYNAAAEYTLEALYVQGTSDITVNRPTFGSGEPPNLPNGTYRRVAYKKDYYVNLLDKAQASSLVFLTETSHGWAGYFSDDVPFNPTGQNFLRAFPSIGGDAVKLFRKGSSNYPVYGVNGYNYNMYTPITGIGGDPVEGGTVYYYVYSAGANEVNTTLVPPTTLMIPVSVTEMRTTDFS